MPRKSKNAKTIEMLKSIFGSKVRINHTCDRISLNYKNSERALNKACNGLGSKYHDYLHGIRNPDNFKSNLKKLEDQCSEEINKIKSTLPKDVTFRIVRKYNTWLSPPTFRWGIRLSFPKTRSDHWKDW